MKSNIPAGKELENAVFAIEEMIFSQHPKLKGAEVIIENRKIINYKGTRHEVDVYVEVNPNSLYKSIFIFECKDWKDPVDKNEIIIFKEKINAYSAQKGWFVAPKFTKDAVAQAKQDNRIELTNVLRDFDISRIPPIRIVSSYVLAISTSLEVDESDATIVVDPDKTILTKEGVEHDFKSFIIPFALKVVKEKEEMTKSDALEVGDHKLSHAKTFDFHADKLYVEGIQVSNVTVEVEFILQLVKAKILRKFDVQTRGRVAIFEPVNTLNGDINISFGQVAGIDYN